MDTTTLAGAALVAALATVNVGLWTLRVALAARGRRALAAMTSGADAVLFVVTFSTVLSSLDDPLRVGAYAVGVALGTHLGLVVETWTRRDRDPLGEHDGVTSPRPVRWRRARRRAAAPPPCARPAGEAAPRSVPRAAR